MSLNHASLFSGLGGFDLASTWCGWNNKFNCEINPVLRRVLNYYWPEAESYEDIKQTDFTIWRGRIDVLSGGFPCQPYSNAGKRLGTEDNRHLWPEMLRAIREIKPPWVVGENVRGLINWSSGMVFEQVQIDLEAEGYEVQPFLLPACAVNAPHRRDRVWFIAHANKASRVERRWEEVENKKRKACQSKRKRGGVWDRSNAISKNRTTSNANSFRQQKQRESERSGNQETDGEWKASWSYDDGRWPTQSPVCGGDDGFPGELDGITVSKHRKESLMGYGNAVVPELVKQLFNVINEMSI